MNSYSSLIPSIISIVIVAALAAIVQRKFRPKALLSVWFVSSMILTYYFIAWHYITSPLNTHVSAYVAMYLFILFLLISTILLGLVILMVMRIVQTCYLPEQSQMVLVRHRLLLYHLAIGLTANLPLAGHCLIRRDCNREPASCRTDGGRLHSRGCCQPADSRGH
jgi:hypothetical protein